MSFNQSDYTSMLLQYRSFLYNHSNSSEAVDKVACSWLRSNTRKRTIWKSQVEKRVLYIGGIFPLNPITRVSYYASSIVLGSIIFQTYFTSLINLFNIHFIAKSILVAVTVCKGVLRETWKVIHEKQGKEIKEKS